MSKKYLIISIVTLIIFAGWAGLYYFLGVEEELWVIPPPIPDPVIQNTETSTGVNDVVSGEKTQEILQEITNESRNTIFRSYKDRIIMIKDWVETELFSFINTLHIESSNSVFMEKIFLSPDKRNLLFEYRYWVEQPMMNGININSKELLWWEGIAAGELYWSPDNKNIAVIRRSYDTLIIKISFNWNLSNLKELVSINYLAENDATQFYWESNDTFIFKPDPKYKEYIAEGFKEAKLSLDTNKFFIWEKNTINLSSSEISEILSKIDENTKKQAEIRKSATGVMVQGEYRAEYLPSENNTDDIIRITNNWKSTEYPLQYNALNIEIKKNNWWDDAGKFLYFDGFSPSNHYLLYTVWVWWYWSYTKYLIDVENGKTVLEILSALAWWIWTPDKKQFIYSNEWGWLMITKKWEFPKTENIWWNIIFNKIDVDEKFIYGIGFSDMSWTPKYLKIYDLTTLKEVYSQEVQ